VNWERYLPEGVLDNDNNYTHVSTRRNDYDISSDDDEDEDNDSINYFNGESDDDFEDHCWPLTV
jgi:hypothetical protein